MSGRRGTITIKSNPINAGWVATNLRTIILQKSTHWSEASETTSGFPTWGSGNGRGNSQRIRL